MTEGFKRVLLIEDNEGDARLVQEMLADSGAGFDLTVAGTLADGIELAVADPPDAVLLDLGLPDSDGLETFTRFHAAAPAVPVIILTIQDDNDALTAIQQGAQNFLSKQELTPSLLAHAIAFSIERARLLFDLQRSQAEAEQARRRYQAISETVASYTFEKTLAPDGTMKVSWVSEQFHQLTGLTASPGDDAKANRRRMIHPDDQEKLDRLTEQVLRGETSDCEFRFLTLGGRTIWFRSVERPTFDVAGRVNGSIGGVTDITARKLAEFEAEAARRKYQMVSETISDLMYEKELAEDGSLKVIWINDKYIETTGYNLSDLADLAAARKTIIHPEDHDQMVANLAPVTDGRTCRAEYRIRCRNGGEKWLAAVERPVVEDGRVVRSLGAAQDITARKEVEQLLLDQRDRLEAMVAERTEKLIGLNRELQEKIRLQEDAEKSLRRARAILENIFNTSHLQIAYLDRNFKFIRVNEAYARSAGAPVDFFLGRNHFELYPHPENQVIFQRVVDTGEPFTIFAKPFSFPDHPEWGTTYWDWSLNPIKGADGRVEEIIFTLNDVTHTIRTELALTVEKERLYNVLELMPASIYLMDRDYNLIFINHVFRERFGDTLGRKCHSVLHHRDEPCAECGSKKLFAGEITYSHAETSPVDGRNYEVFARVIKEDGNQDRVLKMAIDVTERKLAERGKLKAEARLEEQRIRAIHADRLRSLGELTTSIAHELNQPLVGVRGVAEHIALAVKRGWRLPDDVLMDKANQIVEQADRMSSIIEHSRVFVRGSQDQSRGPVRINQVINAALVMAGGQLQSDGFRIRLELAPDLPVVSANQYSLEEVLLNLFSNARDACAEKRFIDGGPALTIRTAVIDGGREVRVEVEDNGPGIPAEIVPRMFEPFFTTKDLDHGTGLGLPIARSIIENYGGTIAVESQPGAGARFIVTLPASEIL